MNKKLIITFLALASVAGVVYYGYQLLGGTTAGKQPLATNSLVLSVEQDTLKLNENGNTAVSVVFDSLKSIKPGNFQLFDTLVFRTDWYSKSQLNYPSNRNLPLRSITKEKETITDFLKKAGTKTIPDTLSLRQLLFRVMLDSVRNAAKEGKIIVINNNKEIVHAEQPATTTPGKEEIPGNRGYITRLLVCAGILSLLAIAALLLNNNNAMAKLRKKKRTETDEDFLKRTVYELLGKDTDEARYFTDVLTGHKRYEAVKDQLKPEARTDTGTIIGNMKSAGILSAGESKQLYEIYELKEKVAAIKSAGTTAPEKQRHLLQLLQSFTTDEALKQHLKKAEDEGVQWQQMMHLDEKDLPQALQQMLRFYDEKYGSGAHKLSPVYAETLRRAQRDLPENFAREDQFLKALYEKYRNLLDDVLFTWFEQQQSEEKVAEARQALVNRLAQLAFHAHNFLTHYNKDTAALPPGSVKANMQMIIDNGTVTRSLPREAYKTYSRDITRFEREIFLQKLLAGIGVTNLENVLLKDVYYPDDSFK